MLRQVHFIKSGHNELTVLLFYILRKRFQILHFSINSFANSNPE